MLKDCRHANLYNCRVVEEAAQAAAEGATPVIAQARYHHIQNSGETGPRKRQPAPKGQEARASKLSGRRTEGRDENTSMFSAVIPHKRE
jgi:hypothetical protein